MKKNRKTKLAKNLKLGDWLIAKMVSGKVFAIPKAFNGVWVKRKNGELEFIELNPDDTVVAL